MKLFLIHCGYYDREVGSGIFELHVDLFVAAEDFVGARAAAKALPEFKAKKMHVDGVLQLEAASGHRITLAHDAELEGATVTHRTPESWRALNAKS